MSQKPQEICVTISSQLKELNRIEQLTEKIAKKLDFSEDQQDNLAIAVTEAVGNAIVHGNKKDPHKKVYIAFQLGEDRVEVSVRDEGEGFDPDTLTDPLDPNNLMKESGRGIFILKSLMDDVSFSFTPKGTTIRFTMKKKG
jgi:serine/threonine-protein kinase RsbW